MTNLWLAPLHGITLFTFRNCLFRHTYGIKTAITPFFPIQETAKLNVRKHSDFFPSNNNPNVEIIPQLIGNNPEHFVDTVRAINNEFGYTRFNWNIGCPMQQIARKKRGCGLMPYPDRIENVVDKVCSETPFHLSIKMRLGLYKKEESISILQQLNSYPLDFIVIHPRLGIQQYEGTPDLDALKNCLSNTSHKVIYSGDIQCVEDYLNLKKQFPNISDWMLGRGILRNPFLAEQIQFYEENNFSPQKDFYNLRDRFSDFYDDYITSSLQIKKEQSVLSNLKELWHYFSTFYSLPEDSLQKILRVTDFKEFITITKQICKNDLL